MEKKCICCGNSELSIIYKNLSDKEYNNKEKFSMIKCNVCGFEFIDPLLGEKQLEKFYPKDEYYSYQDYNPLAFNYHKLSAYYHSNKNFLIKILLFPISPLLYTYFIDEGKSILEIGCGNGMKLEIYQI